MHPEAARRFVALTTTCVVAAAVAGCGGTTPAATTAQRATIPALPGDAEPRPEPRSKYGNGPVYEVFGEQYTVLPSGNGYRERGVASWYGKKFHGRLTSNREPYDMYAMTAAHKTLPLPSYVRVRNLRNSRSVVVRVNDRGPFVHNRIIDLSYAAAMKLDMVQDGTSLVEVTAITFDEPTGDRPVRNVTPAEPPENPAAPSADAGSGGTRPNSVYAQIGAFGSRENATNRLEALRKRGIFNAFIDTDDASGSPLFRVRVGPITEVVQFDVLVEELGYMGIEAPYLVTE